jgi:hypothetical protein
MACLQRSHVRSLGTTVRFATVGTSESTSREQRCEQGADAAGDDKRGPVYLPDACALSLLAEHNNGV